MAMMPRDADTAPGGDATERTALYRFYDAEDELLYVGISKDPKTRWEQHRDKPWRPDVAMRVVEWFDDRATAEHAERKAIQNEAPRYNVRHNHRPTPLAPQVRAEEPKRGYRTLVDLYPDGISDAQARKIVGLLRLGDVR